MAVMKSLGMPSRRFERWRDVRIIADLAKRSFHSSADAMAASRPIPDIRYLPDNT